MQLLQCSISPYGIACRIVVGSIFTLGAASAGAATVSFESTPAGAQVCLKKKGIAHCFGATPLKVEVDFRDELDTKRYLFKKIGYQVDTRLVKQADRFVRVSLKRRDVLFDPGQHDTTHLKRLQQRVNAILRQLLYESGSPIGPLDTELVGQIRLDADESRTILLVGILLTNKNRRREIGSARRKHASAERNLRIARIALGDEAIEMLRLLADAIHPLSEIDEIVLSIDYTKETAFLADETVHYYRTYVAREYYKMDSSGNVQRVTKYATVRENEDITAVKDRLEIRTVIVGVPVQRLYALGSRKKDVDAVLGISTVLLNDNRKKQFRRVVTK